MLTGSKSAHPHIAYAAYATPLKQMLFTIKYHADRKLANSLGQYLGLWYLSQWPAPDLIVPIPLHPERLASRGYNQAEELALGLGKSLHRPCRLLLERQINTPALHDLNPTERHAVMRTAFVQARQQSFAPGSRILLIDDILTTGSTLLHAAACLRTQTDRIVSLSLARALFKPEHSDKQQS